MGDKRGYFQGPSNRPGTSRGRSGHNNRAPGVMVPGVDRFCSNCGQIVKGQSVQKPLTCPHSKCNTWFPFRLGFEVSGWGRCANCDSFLNKEHCFCQSCGSGNAEALEKKRRFAIIAAEKEKVEKEAKIRRLEDQVVKLQNELDAKKRDEEIDAILLEVRTDANQEDGDEKNEDGAEKNEDGAETKKNGAENS